MPLTSPPAREVASLPWHRGDPFDRMPVAQAKAEKMTLLTADDAVAL